jgi:hypothetical protein
MSPGVFEASIPASEWPQTHALDRAATQIGLYVPRAYSTIFYFSSITKQYATLQNSFISARLSTSFRRFICPSPGAQKMYIEHRVFIKPLLLPFTVVEELSSNMFQAVPPPITRSSKNVHRASGIYQAVTATFHYRGGAGTPLSTMTVKASSNGLINTRCCMYSF